MTLEELIESYLSTLREQNDNNSLGGNKLPDVIIDRYKGNESEFLKLLSSKELEVSKFFLLVSILKDAVEKLTFNVQELFQCCIYLVKVAGDDLASHEPKIVFIDYLLKKPEEFKAVFEQVIKDSSYNTYLDWFLLVGYQIDEDEYIRVSIDLLKRSDEESLRSVLFALSRVKVTKEDQIEQMLNEIENQLENETIDVRSHILRLISSIYSLPENMHSRALSIIEIIFEDLDDNVIHNVACLLRIYDDFPVYLEPKFIEVIVQVNLDNLGTLDQIDRWLYHLARNGDIEKIITFIQIWNNSREKVLNVGVFKNLTHSFYHSPEKVNLLITSVFLSQDYYLMCSFYRAWGEFIRDQSIVVNEELLLTSDIEKSRVFLAKKAYSWLFIYSENMITYIFSLLPYVNEDEQEEMTHILRLLALNYPTLFDKTFDIRIENTDKNEWLYILKKDIDKYFQDLTKLPKINELRVPKENSIYRNMLFEDQMRKYTEESEKTNSFLSLISKQVVLYGRGTISQFNDFPRQETILRTMGHSSYLPSVLSLNPHNHSQILKEYQEDGCKDNL